jgi:preprotein translocase subunit SecY
MLFGWLNGVERTGTPSGWSAARRLPQHEFRPAASFYILTEVVMIYFFAYFWTTVQFQPKEMANQLADYGSSSRPASRASGRPTTSRR